MADYPDIENVLIDVLEAYWPTELGPDPVRRVDTETPEDLQQLAVGGEVVVRITKVTGRDNGVTDYSVVDIDVFADSRAPAYAWASEIRSRLTGSPHRVGTVVIDRVVTEESPRRLPWADENIHRYGGTYRVSARR